MCYITTYGSRTSRAGTQERQRRAADPCPRRGSATTWIRHRQADRGAIRGGAAFQRRVVVSPPLPTREARLDRRTLDRESRPAQATALPVAPRGWQSGGPPRGGG